LQSPTTAGPGRVWDSGRACGPKGENRARHPRYALRGGGAEPEVYRPGTPGKPPEFRQTHGRAIALFKGEVWSQSRVRIEEGWAVNSSGPGVPPEKGNWHSEVG